MKMAAAKAIAGLIPDDELNEENILPKAFDPRVADAVAAAVALKTGNASSNALAIEFTLLSSTPWLKSRKRNEIQ